MNEPAGEIHPKVAAALRGHEDAYKIWRHADLPGPIRSPKDVARALGFDAKRLAKTILLANAKGTPESRAERIIDNYVALCLGAPYQIDFNKIAHAMRWAGSQIATLPELQKLLEYPPNGVSPLGLGQILLLIDSPLMEFDSIAIGAGSAGFEVEMAPSLLRKLVPASLVAAVGATMPA